MSVENLDNQQAGHSGNRSKDSSSKHKKLMLHDKTFLIDIVDKIVCSKVENLINTYGGKKLQMLEKNTNYLISDKIIDPILNHSCNAETHSTNVAESKSLSCSKQKNSNDLITKANLLNIQIFSPKQFQHWLKSLLKKAHLRKKPTDRVASVLRGKVSLKIESLDTGQCPVFEFIPKWPDLGDTLCKKKTEIGSQNMCSGDNSLDEYNSSDQYSTSEIGGMCELCDVPFMNYKEHINTKKHLRESQDEKKFHELDELMNERPLNVIFNQFTPEKYKVTEEENNCDLEAHNSKDCTENTIISIINSNLKNNQKINVPCLFGDNNSIVIKEQPFTSLKRKCCSDTNISFVPQKRPSNWRSPEKTDTKVSKKIKRKHKKFKKPSSKDIYKVEVVNTNLSCSNNFRIVDKPPVIIRLKRIKHSKQKNSISKTESLSSNDSTNNCKNLTNAPLDKRNIRVVRKPSTTYEPKRLSSSKGFSQNYVYSFEKPELIRCFPKNSDFYYPTKCCVPNYRSGVEHIQEKIVRLDTKCTFEEFIKRLSILEPNTVGRWFYDIPDKIQDDLSFDSSVLLSLTDL